jgi:hypothetical protein
MADRGDSKHREQSGAAGIERAERVLQLAWLSLPPAHRALLEAIGASQWQVVDQRLGAAVDGFLRSAGDRALSLSARRRLDRALGVWIQELRIILVHAGHEKLADLDKATYEAFIARTAWHEWGHALSVARRTTSQLDADCSTWRPSESGKVSEALAIVRATIRTSWSLRRTRC